MRNAIGIQQALRKSVLSKRARSGARRRKHRLAASGEGQAGSTADQKVKPAGETKRETLIELGTEYADKILVNHGRGLFDIHERS